MEVEGKVDVKVVGKGDVWWVVLNDCQLIGFRNLRDAAILRDNLINALKGEKD